MTLLIRERSPHDQAVCDILPQCRVGSPKQGIDCAVCRVMPLDSFFEGRE